MLLREVRTWNAELMKRLDPRTPADELLVQITWDSLRSMDERPLVRDLLFHKHSEMLPDLKDKLAELRRIGMEPVAEVLRIGVRQGRFRKELDIDEVAGALLDLHVATLMFHAEGPDLEARLAPRAAATFDLLLRGLLKS